MIIIIIERQLYPRPDQNILIWQDNMILLPGYNSLVSASPPLSQSRHIQQTPECSNKLIKASKSNLFSVSCFPMRNSWLVIVYKSENITTFDFSGWSCNYFIIAGIN